MPVVVAAVVEFNCLANLVTFCCVDDKEVGVLEHVVILVREPLANRDSQLAVVISLNGQRADLLEVGIIYISFEHHSPNEEVLWLA